MGIATTRESARAFAAAAILVAAVGCSKSSSALDSDSDSSDSSSKPVATALFGTDARGACYQAALEPRGLASRATLAELAARRGLELGADVRASVDSWPPEAFGDAAADVEACREPLGSIAQSN